MKPTSDERREVAQALRDANDTELYVMYLDEILAGALGICPTDSYENVERKILDRLADLIDPTCRAVEKGHPDEHHVCYGCNACDFGWHEDVHDEPYRYCPHCGARVVSDDDQ